MTRRQHLAWLTGGGALLIRRSATGQPRTGAAAPELGGGPWHNGGPHTLASLRGRVVLVEFWTFG